MTVESSPTEPSWTSVIVEAPEASAPLVCALLWSVGAQGVSEDHPGLHFDDDNELYVTDEWKVPEPANPTDVVTVTGWFEELVDRSLLEASLADLAERQGLPPLQPRYEGIVNQDWSALWKKGWTVTRFTDRILVVPEWLDVPALEPGEHALVLDPGMAFGTGTHETTRLCAELLQSELESRPNLSVFDVGTGTGILAVAALLLGATDATGCDTDPAALVVSTETAQRNGVADRFECYEGSADSTERRWPLVLGNLLAPLIKTISQDLADRTDEEGALIVSGLLTSQAEGVRESLEAVGMKQTDRLDRGDWSALRFVHRSGASR